MTDITEALAALTVERVEVLCEIADELLAKREAQREREARNEHIRAGYARGSGVYKPPEVASASPAPRRVKFYRQADAVGKVFEPVYADE